MLKKNTGNEYQILESTLQALKALGFSLIVGVPCSMLEGLLTHPYLKKHFRYISATNEGEAVAIATGATIAGEKAMVFCQNSGLGNMVNPITSLSNTFGIPLLFIISLRGNPQEFDAPQHRLMGNITHEMLRLLGIDILQFPGSQEAMLNIIANISSRYKEGLSSCLIVDKTLPSYEASNYDLQINSRSQNFLDTITKGSYKPQRREVMEKIIRFLPEKYVYVATTGETSRELCEIKDTDNNFYMVGSMGYASSIGLGISLFTKDKVVVFDGDGALLMHMGNMSTIGTYANKNLYHIVLNNNIYSSTGGQCNSSINIDFIKIAKACNYATIAHGEITSLEDTLNKLEKSDGPHFLEIKIDISRKIKANRPFIDPKSNAIRLMNYLKN